VLDRHQSGHDLVPFVGEGGQLDHALVGRGVVPAGVESLEPVEKLHFGLQPGPVLEQHLVEIGGGHDRGG
jgi:hypothetical protein